MFDARFTDLIEGANGDAELGFVVACDKNTRLGYLSFILLKAWTDLVEIDQLFIPITGALIRNLQSDGIFVRLG